MGEDMCSFTVAYSGTMAILGAYSNKGFCSPLMNVTLPEEDRTRANIPHEAIKFFWAYAIPGVGELANEIPNATMSLHTNPNWRFLFYGGFMYFNDANEVIAANAIGAGDSLHFHRKQVWRSAYTKALHDQNRFHPITLHSWHEAGACHMVWIFPGEEIAAADHDPWIVSEHGAFVFLHSEDISIPDERDCIFAVAPG